MRIDLSNIRQFLGSVLALSLLTAMPARSQTTEIRSNQPQDDVVRVNTNLVQTDVMVFDKQGNFAPGLQPEQFTVTVDGQPQPVTFFEQVAAGSAQEQKQLAAIQRAQQKGSPSNSGSVATGTARGRTIFFFVDDVHLAPEGLNEARKSLLQFIDTQMTDDDQVAIVSTSGQVGFLQQLTDNQTVLHTAVARLGNRQSTEAYSGKTRITEYEASRIAEFNDKALYAYLLESVKLEQQTGPGSRHGDHRLASSYSAAPMLSNRIAQINENSKLQAENTLRALEGLVASSSALPGRKLLFFMSDGFPFDKHNSQNLDLLKKVTTAAAAAGTVFYSVDMRGNYLDSGADASEDAYADFSSRQAGVMMAGESATREVMNTLADDTGGRMIANSNKIPDDIRKAVNETGQYYLLAWTLSPEQMAESRLRVKVTVKDHPELRVRMRSENVLTPSSPATEPSKSSKGKEAVPDPQVQLLAALGAVYPQRQIPLSVSAGYVANAADELLLRVSMQIERSSLMLNPSAEDATPTKLEVAGAAIDDRGVIVSFKQTVSIPPGNGAPEDPVVWQQQLKIPPGLYQVRVAVRESATGRTGSAQQWVEAPAPQGGKLAVSSIFLGERVAEAEAAGSTKAGPAPLLVDVDHKFGRASVLRFQAYVYNAARSDANSPDVWLDAQVMRNGKPVMSVAPSQLPAVEGAALPYWAELRLDQLQAGRYTLLINATDRRAGASTAQRVKFTVE